LFENKLFRIEWTCKKRALYIKNSIKTLIETRRYKKPKRIKFSNSQKRIIREIINYRILRDIYRIFESINILDIIFKSKWKKQYIFWIIYIIRGTVLNFGKQ
jgi:hypothetical protein